MKYLMGRAFEPGFEYYVDDNTNAVGPAAFGQTNVADIPVKWEFGVLFGLGSTTGDTNIRWLAEFEFQDGLF